MTIVIRPNGSLTSDVFALVEGKQASFIAKGLQGTDKVVFEVVTMTRPAPTIGDPCCGMAPVVLPEVDQAVPLQAACDCTVQNVELTVAKPYLVLREPYGLNLRLRVVADPDSSIEVSRTDTRRT